MRPSPRRAAWRLAADSASPAVSCQDSGGPPSSTPTSQAPLRSWGRTWSSPTRVPGVIARSASHEQRRAHGPPSKDRRRGWDRLSGEATGAGRGEGSGGRRPVPRSGRCAHGGPHRRASPIPVPWSRVESAPAGRATYQRQAGLRPDKISAALKVAGAAFEGASSAPASTSSTEPRRQGRPCHGPTFVTERPASGFISVSGSSPLADEAALIEADLELPLSRARHLRDRSPRSTLTTAVT